MTSVSTQISGKMGAASALAAIWGDIIINVKASPYLAAGSGLVDDTAKLQAAIDAGVEDNVPVYLPSGTYKVSNLVIPAGTDPFILKSDGAIIDFDGTTDCCLEVNGSFRRIHGIKFTSDSSNTIIRFQPNTYRNQVDSCEFMGNNRGVGIEFVADANNGSYWNKVSNCNFQRLDKDIFANDQIGTYGCNANTFIDNTHLYTVVSCIETKDSYNAVIGGNFEQMNYTNLAAFRIIGTDGALSVVGATVESASNTSYAIYFDSTVGNMLDSSFIFTQSAQGKFRAKDGTTSTNPADMPFNVDWRNRGWGRRYHAGAMIMEGSSTDTGEVWFKTGNPASGGYDIYRMKAVYDAGNLYLNLQTWFDSTTSESWLNVARYNMLLRSWESWNATTSSWQINREWSGNVSVASGATTKDIALYYTQPNSSYAVAISPNWNTTVWITNKTTTGFRINFGTAAPSTQAVDWTINN